MAKFGVPILKKLLLLLVPLLAFASVQDAERRIWIQIVSAIFQNKKIVKVYSLCPKLSQKIPKNSNIILVDTPKKADLIIANKYVNFAVDKPIFVRKYYLLQRYKNRAVGGFYWQKGRPNIIFEEKSLKKFGIILPESFQRYVEYEEVD